MEKILKGMIVAVGLLVVLSGVALAECLPPTGYPTIDAWRLAGCRNELDYYGGYGGGYPPAGYPPSYGGAPGGYPPPPGTYAPYGGGYPSGGIISPPPQHFPPPPQWRAPRVHPQSRNRRPLR